MKKPAGYLISVVILAFLFASCTSAPKTQDTEKETVVSDTIAVESEYSGGCAFGTCSF